MNRQDRIDMLEGRLKRLKKDAENYTHALSRYPGYLLSCVEPDKDYPLRRTEFPQFLIDYREMLDKAEATIVAYWQGERSLQEARDDTQDELREGPGR